MHMSCNLSETVSSDDENCPSNIPTRQIAAKVSGDSASRQQPSLLDVSSMFNEAKVGEGSYGVVYRVRHKSTGNVYALKRMQIKS
ncbi:MAG: hypothetical protein MHPSP_002952, partial [Paramarteilia canceri]